MQGVRPGLKVCVDTQPPTIRLRALAPRDGEVGVEWDVRDENLDAISLRLEYRLPAVAEWLPLGGELSVSGQRYWKPAAPGVVEVRLKVRDRADNWSEEKVSVSAGSFTSQPLENRQHPSDPPAPIRQDGVNLVNSKRISLNYELKEVGPSKVSLVELWLTRNVVHADLSAFNVLYWEGEVTTIDFPQFVDPRTNRNAYDLLTRDVENLGGYFERFGVRTNARNVAADLWTRFIFAEL